MKIFLGLSYLLLSSLAFAQSAWIVTDDVAFEKVDKHLTLDKRAFNKSNGRVLAQVDVGLIGMLSHYMHSDVQRCGGFFQFETREEAEAFLNGSGSESLAEKAIFADYSINQNETVEAMIGQVDAKNIEQTIRQLSSFQNRFYKAETGVQSQTWVRDHWASLAAGRNDVKVEFFTHASWQQPSVVMTVTGKSPEVIVIGGHADSISGYFGSPTARAPGADDNASGISTITEVIRIMMASNYKPEKTIKFMGYAAEEVGLLGSKEIAQTYKRNSIPVVGVLQLDMTNFNGSRSQDITLITDYTNQQQNEFLAKLVDEYLQMSWGWDQCGYACSDHASWHSQGFPASTPFETKKNDMNKKIHTAQDTIDVSGGNANHAAKFAKLAVAYLVELDR
jgi:leucyl aminopeptidase